MFLYNIGYAVMALPIRLMWPTKIINKQYMPKLRRKEAGILCANHTTYVDPLIIGSHMYRRLRFFAKKEFSKNFIGRFIFWGVGAISVDRGKPDIGAIKKSLKYLKKKKVLMLFPEGTRNKQSGADEGDMLALKNGAVMLAIRSGAKIIPAQFYHKPRIFRRNYLYYGEPIDFSQFEGKTGHGNLAAATALLTEKMAEARQAVNEYAEARKRVKKQKMIEA